MDINQFRAGAKAIQKAVPTFRDYTSAIPTVGNIGGSIAGGLAGASLGPLGEAGGLVAGSRIGNSAGIALENYLNQKFDPRLGGDTPTLEKIKNANLSPESLINDVVNVGTMGLVKGGARIFEAANETISPAMTKGGTAMGLRYIYSHPEEGRSIGSEAEGFPLTKSYRNMFDKVHTWLSDAGERMNAERPAILEDKRVLSIKDTKLERLLKDSGIQLPESRILDSTGKPVGGSAATISDLYNIQQNELQPRWTMADAKTMGTNAPNTGAARAAWSEINNILDKAGYTKYTDAAKDYAHGVDLRTDAIRFGVKFGEFPQTDFRSGGILSPGATLDDFKKALVNPDYASESSEAMKQLETSLPGITDIVGEAAARAAYGPGGISRISRMGAAVGMAREAMQSAQGVVGAPVSAMSPLQMILQFMVPESSRLSAMGAGYASKYSAIPAGLAGGLANYLMSQSPANQHK